MLLSTACGGGPGDAVEMKAQVVWCRRLGDSHDFVAGLRVFHDELAAASLLEGLVARAQAEASAADWRRGAAVGCAGAEA